MFNIFFYIYKYPGKAVVSIHSPEKLLFSWIRTWARESPFSKYIQKWPAADIWFQKAINPIHIFDKLVAIHISAKLMFPLKCKLVWEFWFRLVWPKEQIRAPDKPSKIYFFILVSNREIFEFKKALRISRTCTVLFLIRRHLPSFILRMQWRRTVLFNVFRSHAQSRSVPVLT
jgi:hypothetical protein